MPGNLLARFLRFGLRENDALFQILADLPAIAGMGFADIDEIELDILAVLAVQLVQGTNLVPKGRSGIRAEDQRHRLLALKRAELDGLLAVERFQ